MYDWGTAKKPAAFYPATYLHQMKYFLPLAACIAIACNTPAPTPAPAPAPAPPKQVAAAPPQMPDTSVALAFINSYVQYVLSESKPKPSTTTWIQNNTLLTASFKQQYQSIVKEATKNDPEIGLDADPILDAQDLPQEGFVMKRLDPATGYLTVRGKDWTDFELTLKLVQQNGQWLVDGSGYINIPANKQAKR
jgi:hypothetical protein